TGVGEARVSRARMPRLVKELLATVKTGTAPLPVGPARMTLFDASRSDQRYVSAAACAALRIVASPVTRTVALKARVSAAGVGVVVAPNGCTEYAALPIAIGMSESDTSLGDVPVYGP